MKTKKTKGFFARLTDKLDKKLEAKAKKTKCCCCGDDKCCKK